MTRPVARAVGETLAGYGVRQVFGVVGSGNYAVTHALVKAGAWFVAARHEGAAVTMADAYGRVSGEVAVCSVHQGPGLTNTITGLVEAVKSRTPLVVVAGQSSAGALRSNFYLDQDLLAASVGAIAERIHRPETAVDDVTRAFRRTVAERRPVVLSLPLDIQAARTRAVARPTQLPLAVAPVQPSTEDIASLAALLTSAQRPLLLAGRGALAGNTRNVLRALGDRTGALLATTAIANGLFGADPWTLGVIGGLAPDAVAAIVAEADLVLGFGVSFTDWTTRSKQIFASDAVVVQIDRDPLALGLSSRVDRAVAADAGATAQALLTAVERRPGWRATASMPPPLAPPGQPATGKLHPGRLAHAVGEMLPTELTLVVDGGHFIGWPITTWRVPDPEGFVFTSAGFQSIGLGLAAAIGAHLARPQRLTVLAVGDGGFLMSLSELETLVRLKLPVLVVVYNDAAYGAEVHHFSPPAAGPQLVRFPDTDIAALACGAGAQALTVRDTGDLAPLRGWLAEPRGPMVVDAKIDETVVGYWAHQDFVGH